MQAITSGPVCPQSLPSFPFRKTHVNYSNASSPSISDAHSEAEKLEMPRPRLRFLQWIRTQLLRQSEDCLYLNIFVPNAALQPKKGKQILIKTQPHCTFPLDTLLENNFGGTEGQGS